MIITTKDELTSFMEKKGLTEFYAPSYLYDLSEKYGIDPGFVLATFILETGWGERKRAMAGRLQSCRNYLRVGILRL